MKKFFNKYDYYERSVQSPESDIDFFKKTFKKYRKKEAKIFREDFGGTGFLSSTWANQGKDYRAYVIDVDKAPLDYGRRVHLPKLSYERNLTFFQSDVRQTKCRNMDIIVALNFSYFIFKKRSELIDYFSCVKKSLNKDGIFFLDIFGGNDCYQELEEKTTFGDFTYYWDCQSFDPVSHDCSYAIHYRPKGVKKNRKCFYL